MILVYTMDAIWFVVVPVILALLTNGILAINPNTSRVDRKRNPYLPPGWLIGSIWVILFGLLGYTLYLVQEIPYIVPLILFTIVYCIAYPAVTNFEPTTNKTRFLNVGAFLLASILIYVLYTQNQKNALKYVIPLWVWTSYVNIAEIVYDNIELPTN